MQVHMNVLRLIPAALHLGQVAAASLHCSFCKPINSSKTPIDTIGYLCLFLVFFGLRR